MPSVIGRRPADRRRTWGYHRFEILAAAFNASLLFLVAIYILYEAYQRFREPAEVQSLGMLLNLLVREEWRGRPGQVLEEAAPLVRVRHLPHFPRLRAPS